MLRVTIEEVANSIKFGDARHDVVVSRVSEPTDEFYFNVGISSDDGEKCISIDDPLYMLFNQQRINQLEHFGDDIVKSWLDDMKAKLSIADPLRELRTKMSDDDIIQCVRSRRIQSPSELKAWCDYCNRSVDNFNNELKSAKEQYDKEQAEKKEKESVTIDS